MGKWVLSLMVAAAVAVAYGTDWPVWRGPDRNGISKETGWNPVGAGKRWTKELGFGYSSVSVKDGNLYTMGYDSSEDKKGQEIVYCLEAETGNEIWTYLYPCKTGSYKGPRATPVIDGANLYTVSQEGLVICFEAASGKINWKTDVLKETGNENIRWDVASSAVIEGDLLLLNIGDAGTALKKATGAVAWKSQGKFSYASPVLFDRDGVRCAAIFSEPGLQVVEAATGTKLSSFGWETKYGINGADPLIIGDMIFITSGYDRGCAMLDFSSGKLKPVWENKLLNAHFSSSVYIDGFIYGMDGQAGKAGSLRCLSAKNGSEQWKEPLGFGSLIAAGDRLIVLTEDGTLYFAEVSSGRYKQIAKMETGLEKLCWTPPVLANGMIYCRNDKGTLVAIDVSK